MLKLQFMIEEPRPDLVTLSTALYDLSVSRNLFSKAEMRLFCALGTETLNSTAPELHPFLAGDGPIKRRHPRAGNEIAGGHATKSPEGNPGAQGKNEIDGERLPGRRRIS